MKKPKSTSPLTYAKAGVNIDKANAFVKTIGRLAAKTKHPAQINGIGGFGALYALPEGYRQPVLVASTDGVGTKLKLATHWKQHDTIGIDLVAMCVNDIITCGACPLFFLDYYATGQLDIAQSEAIMAGIVDGCEQAQMALIGGETAEMPSVYQGPEYDLAGFCVGVIEKDNIIDGQKIAASDVIIGIASNGPHANGYSLIRSVLDHAQATGHERIDSTLLKTLLLKPTRIYVKAVLRLIEQVTVHALAHITGGGLIDNIPRVLPSGIQAKLNAESWKIPHIFQWLQQKGRISSEEMYRTFNMGIGMIAIVPKAEADKALACLEAIGEQGFIIGHVVHRSDTTPSVVIH